MKTLWLSVFLSLCLIQLEVHAAVLGPRIQWQKLLQYHSNPQKSTELLDKYRVPFITAKAEPKTKLRKPNNSAKLQKPELFADPFMQRSYAPASPYQGSYPAQAMYPAQQPAAPQYMYPAAQPAAPAYAPSPYQAPQPYYPAQPDLSSYAPPDQQQAYGQQGQEPVAASPPAPKLPELMSTLLAMSQKNQASNNQQQQQCSPCNTCNQCSAMAACSPCPVCQSTACTAASSLPLIPKGLRPLWELWNEKTADMNSMEMSALILSPVPKLPPTKKSSSLTEKAEGSGDENSYKRSHVKFSKKKTSKSSKTTHDASKHSVSKSSKSDKTTKKSAKTVSKTKHT